MEMFEKVTRKKMRFPSSVGAIGVEDLWDVPLTELNEIAKDFNRKLKQAEEEDFLNTAKDSDADTRLGFNVVLHVLETKKAEADRREKAAERRAEKAKLLEILADKQNENLKGLSEDELRQRIEGLSDDTGESETIAAE